MLSSAGAVFEGIDFGVLPPQVDALLQKGVLAHRQDRAAAEALFWQAHALDRTALPPYLCLYKVLAYQHKMAQARAVAEAGLAEAAQQAGWSANWQQWSAACGGHAGPERFALYTLKALAFIALRDHRAEDARAMLAVLGRLDPQGTVGWPVVATMLAGCADHATG
ncbi:MAG: hypothetical protein ABF636_05905 [Acetobacter sp.]